MIEKSFCQDGSCPAAAVQTVLPSPAVRSRKFSQEEIHDRLVIQLRDLGKKLRLLYEGKSSQKRILIILKEVGVITQQKLTERLGIQPGSASEVLAKLEGAGLITRTASAADRRTTDVKLTEEGKKEAAEAARQRNRRHEEMFACLSEEEKETLLSLLEKVGSDWEERYRDKRPAAEEKRPPSGGKSYV